VSNSNRVMAFVGSSRVGGNTDVLIDEVLRGAEASGSTIDKAYLGQATIGPCHACDACADTGICIQRDDMDDLLERMLQSDIWVLGTPVYWWGATAQFKLFLDRWYAPWHGSEPKRVFEGKRVVVVVTMGDSDATTADPTLGMFQRALAYIGLDLAATVVAPGVYSLGDAAARSDLMHQAYEVGRSVASG
jgi:multimeric flavodoxin WrbA